jgi:hypothetical protein
VRILNAAIDEHEGHIVIRGALDPETMEHLLTDDYQREVQAVTALSRIMNGFEAGSAVPDVELGMRGSKKTFRDGIYTLHDPVYIIDGLQRISAAKLYRTKGYVPHLGATIHLGSTREWERKQFKILNADRVRVSANVILRNFREDHEAINVFYVMTNDDREFVLKDKVCWQQNLAREHLMSAMTFGKVSLVAHAHLSGCISPSPDAQQLCLRADALMKAVGKNILRANIKTFYNVLDECWGLKTIVFTKKAPFVRATFQLTLARFLSDHEVFWRDNRLLVEADLRRKLAQFPTYDPTVQSISGSGSKIDSELYRMIQDHMNRGKRTRRLNPRKLTEDAAAPDTTVESSDDANQE